jgi:hypothetical protein
VKEINDKVHVGMYFTGFGRKEFSKSVASQIALMGKKTISFGTVMKTA